MHKNLFFLVLTLLAVFFAKPAFSQEDVPQIEPGANESPSSVVIEEVNQILSKEILPSEIKDLTSAKEYLSDNLSVMMGYLVILEKDIEATNLEDSIKSELSEGIDENLDKLELLRADIALASNSQEITTIAEDMSILWVGEKIFIKQKYGMLYYARIKEMHTKLRSIKEETITLNNSTKISSSSVTKNLENAKNRLDNANESNKAAQEDFDTLFEVDDPNMQFSFGIKNLEISSKFVSEAYGFIVDSINELRTK